MENVKNNFEEMKKMLLGALEILEQTNGGLVERIQELEGRVEVLEERVKELEQQAVADVEAYAPTASLFAASAAEVNDEVEETSETEIFEAEQAEAEQAEAEQVEQVETEQVETEQAETEQAVAGQADQAELEEAEQEDQLQEQPMESEEQPVDSQEQAGSAEAVPVEQTETAGAELAESTETAEAEPAEQTEPAEAATAESYEFAEVEQFEAEQQLDGEQQVPEFEAAGAFEAGTGTETVGTMMINDFVADEQRKIVNEAAKPDWYDWEVDYPAAYVDDVYKGISFNDRFEFIKELFNVTGSLDEAEMAFKETLDMINSLENFKQVVAYIRERFPQWDEQSDEVYRFYMAVRRKFNK